MGDEEGDKQRKKEISSRLATYERRSGTKGECLEKKLELIEN